MTTGGAVARPSTARLAALIAAGVLVVVIVVAVLLFGVQRPPALAGLEDGPPPPAAVAWTESRRDETCLMIAWPDGRTTRPWCDPQGGEVVAWPAAGPVWVMRYTATMQLLEVDPDTGEVLRSRTETEPEFRDDGLERAVTTYRDGEELVVSLNDRDVWRTPAPPSYDLRWTRMSPDGDWAVLADAAGRLLVVELDQQDAPRIWVEDVDLWGGVVWQGEALDG